MSDIIEQATKAMHAEVCCPCDPQGCDWIYTREARYAYALVDAGLLARPLPTRDEIATVVSDEILRGRRTPNGVADRVLALLKGQEA